MGGDELIERGCINVRDMNTRTQKKVKVEDVAEYVYKIIFEMKVPGNEDTEKKRVGVVVVFRR